MGCGQSVKWAPVSGHGGKSRHVRIRRHPMSDLILAEILRFTADISSSFIGALIAIGYYEIFVRKD